MVVRCRFCNKKIAKGTEMFSTLKRKLKSYDMYWFCDNDTCLDEYLKNGEKPMPDIDQGNHAEVKE